MDSKKEEKEKEWNTHLRTFNRKEGSEGEKEMEK